MTATPAHLARLAWRDALVQLAIAEDLAGETDDMDAAIRMAAAARTSERIAEFYAMAAMLGKSGTPKE